MLTPKEAVAQVDRMIQWQNGERERLDRIHSYLRSEQRYSWLPAGVPSEVRRMAEMSRVNVCRFVVNASTQALYVDGYRSAEDEQPAWDTWQRNRMDARQIGIHRSALAYGAAYAIVLPGDPVATITGVSPRNMTAVYGEDPDWPMWALERRRSAGGEMWRLFDDEAVYWVGKEHGSLTWITTEIHGVGYCPVIRYLETDDLDDEVVGVVDPLTDLQDQINLTTFSLLVAQHYGAHRQRYIIGWLADSEEQSVKASAQKLWTFEDSPDDIKIGEFEQTELSGYIESREASLRHLATISQTPVHELLGSIANLSAEALVAARDSHNRSLEEHRTMFGESHEQMLETASRIDGQPVDPSAYVRWRDMEARSLAQTADALGKLVSMLGVPAEALWERVPGVSQQEVEAWKELAALGDPITQMTALMDRQSDSSTPAASDADDLKKKFDALGVAIRSGVDPDDAAARLGLAGIEFTGAVPVSLRVPESQASGLEG